VYCKVNFRVMWACCSRIPSSDSSRAAHMCIAWHCSMMLAFRVVVHCAVPQAVCWQQT
jgi:hypothetical protein